MLGKTRRPELRSVLDDYIQRISRHSRIDILEVRDAPAALKRLDAVRTATTVLLDAGGKSRTSDEFARWLADLQDRGTRELFFLCGDAEGFPASLSARAQHKLSLGAMTYSHELARVMLSEQLYRAFAILAGSPYPK